MRPSVLLLLLLVGACDEATAPRPDGGAPDAALAGDDAAAPGADAALPDARRLGGNQPDVRDGRARSPLRARPVAAPRWEPAHPSPCRYMKARSGVTGSAGVGRSLRTLRSASTTAK